MNIENLKNHKDFLLNTAYALGGMATTEVGIFFIQEGHALGDDLAALPAGNHRFFPSI